MRKTYDAAIASVPQLHEFRPVENYSLAFLEGHPKLAGFMQHPLDNGFEAFSRLIEAPYEENILKTVEPYGQFAPYTAYTTNMGGKMEYMVFRFGFK